MCFAGDKKVGGAVFQSKPCLPHGLKGIFIASEAVIGHNVTIFQDVAIAVKGINCFEAPVIGNNVLIGTGAKLLGGIQIGNNVKIGANAVVTKDVPDNCTVVGNPMRIINRSE